MSSNNNNQQQQPSDGGRGGIKFGADLGAYDSLGPGNNDDSELVSELPTLEEERKLYNDDDEYNEDDDEGRIAGGGGRGGSHPSTMAQRSRQAEDADQSSDIDPFANNSNGSGLINTKIADRESSYHARRHDRVLREDGMSYKDAMLNANLDKERVDLINEARKELIDEDTGKFKERLDDNVNNGEGDGGQNGNQQPQQQGGGGRRRRRWDAKEEKDGQRAAERGRRHTSRTA